MALSDIQDLPNPGQDPNLLTAWRNFKKIREYASTPIGPTDGGTGLSSYTTGDIIYASATDVLSRLGIGSTGQFLRVVSGVPAWAGLVNADIPSALSGKTYEGLTLAAQAVGFTIAGGTSSRTLTVGGNASVSGTNTGDQTITLTGDVTGSGTGSFAATIANNAVTLAKLQQIATASILGRSTAGTGNVEVLSASGTRTVLGLGTADSPTFTGQTLSGLAGTGTRIVTATSAGVLGNATTIAGDYTLSGNQLVGGTLGVTGVSRFGTGTPTFGTKNVSVIGASFDGTALQFENTDVDTVAHGRAFNFGITDVSSVLGRLDLTQPGERTVLSVFANGNVGIGSTTDGGQGFQVAGTTRLTGNTTVGGTLGVTGTITGSNLSGTNTGDQTITLTGGVTGSGTGSFAVTVVTNANLTGPITSVGNATSIASQTGTGTTFMMSASPTTTGTLTGAAANFSGAVSTGSLTVSGSSVHNITDNTASAFSVYEGVTGRSYFLVHTLNGTEEITIGNDTTDPAINFYTGTAAYFWCQTEFNNTVNILRALSFGTPSILGTLSTSAGSPTSYSAVDENCLTANVDPGVGNSSYFNLTGGLTTQVVFLRNATGRSLYLMNGGSQVNPLGVGYNATLIYDGSTWQVYGTGV